MRHSVTTGRSEAAQTTPPHPAVAAIPALRASSSCRSLGVARENRDPENARRCEPRRRRSFFHSRCSSLDHRHDRLKCARLRSDTECTENSRRTADRRRDVVQLQVDEHLESRLSKVPRRLRAPMRRKAPVPPSPPRSTREVDVRLAVRQPGRRRRARAPGGREPHRRRRSCLCSVDRGTLGLFIIAELPLKARNCCSLPPGLAAMVGCRCSGAPDCGDGFSCDLRSWPTPPGCIQVTRRRARARGRRGGACTTWRARR